MSVSLACDYCELPVRVSGRYAAAGKSEPLYCCFGCNVAAQITSDRGEAGRANWMLVRLGVAIALSMGVMVFSLAMYGQEVYGPGTASLSPRAETMQALLRYISLFLATPVFFLLAIPILRSARWRPGAGVVWTDVLIVVGVGAAFVHSYIATLTANGAVYYETACMVLVLVTVGRYLEAVGKLRATTAVTSLEALLPDTVAVIRNDAVETVPTNELRIGDVFECRAGERVAADGRVLRGEAHVDEQIVTGESEPAVKETGDAVNGGSINLDGTLRIEATAVGRDSTAGRLATLLEHAKSTGGRFQHLADRVASVLTPLVIVLAAVACVWWGSRTSWQDGMMAALAVLLIACPCALGIATPMAGWISLGRAAERSVLFRSGEAIERLARVRVLAFDKTGTLTTGVSKTASFDCDAPGGEADRARVLSWAAGLAQSSTHILSQSIEAYAHDAQTEPVEMENVRTVPGRGLIGARDGSTYRLGNQQMMQEADVQVPAALQKAMDRAMSDGRSIACIAADKSVVGVFSFSESLRPEAADVLQTLKKDGYRVVVLTGDHEQRAQSIAQALNVEAMPELDPAAKISELNRLRRSFGPVAMVGDGINDAPAMAAADVGLALGCGADLTREAADVCLLANDLSVVPMALTLARRTVRVIKLNLFWAFAYNAVGIPLAMAGKLNPVLAAIAMVTSSLLVVLNSLRLKNVGPSASQDNNGQGIEH